MASSIRPACDDRMDNPVKYILTGIHKAVATTLLYITFQHGYSLTSDMRGVFQTHLLDHKSDYILAGGEVVRPKSGNRTYGMEQIVCGTSLSSIVRDRNSVSSAIKTITSLSTSCA